MKQHLQSLIAVIAISCFSFSTYAQSEQPEIPRWVSAKGYWVIESNVQSPLSHIVRFYNNEGTLLYKETLGGVKLNPEKRAVKMKLKKVLESSVIAWEQKRVVEENREYLASILK